MSKPTSELKEVRLQTAVVLGQVTQVQTQALNFVINWYANRGNNVPQRANLVRSPFQEPLGIVAQSGLRQQSASSASTNDNSNNVQP
jgi:hypothetical protein